MINLDPYIGVIKALTVAAAVVGLFGVGLKTGYEIRDARAVADENAAMITRMQERDRIEAEHEVDRQKLKKGHADEIATIRRANAGGLRVNARLCAGFAETQSAGRGDDRDSATRMVPESVERDFERLRIEIETVFAACRVAQQFITDNGMAP